MNKYPQIWVHLELGHKVKVVNEAQAFEAACYGFVFEKVING